jgi:hypothetical protein
LWLPLGLWSPGFACYGQIMTNSYSKIQQAALTLWKTDQQAFSKSERTAKELGAALNKVKGTMPHGTYTPWLTKSGIDRNRATYCMRLATGKVEKAKKKKKAKKKPTITTLKVGVLVRVSGRVFVVQHVGKPPSVEDDFESTGQLLKGEGYISLLVLEAPTLGADTSFVRGNGKRYVETEDGRGQPLWMPEEQVSNRDKICAAYRAAHPEAAYMSNTKVCRLALAQPSSVPGDALPTRPDNQVDFIVANPVS